MKRTYYRWIKVLDNGDEVYHLHTLPGDYLPGVPYDSLCQATAYAVEVNTSDGRLRCVECSRRWAKLLRTSGTS